VGAAGRRGVMSTSYLRLNGGYRSVTSRTA
jgi:hypothetical protein